MHSSGSPRDSIGPSGCYRPETRSALSERSHFALDRVTLPSFSSLNEAQPVNPLIELKHLCALFPEPNDAPLYLEATHVARESTPGPYHRMLVHEHHMTVTMEAYHDCSVDVQVLESKFVDDLYCRKILLSKAGTDQNVQFGIVRFNFEFVTDSVREQIESENIPLGRVLIQHNVLRHIDLGAIVKFQAGKGLSRYLGMTEGTETFGRMATIFCNGFPAVDLLEISSPLT